MIVCPNCHTENDDDAKFCKNCSYYFLETNNENNKKEKTKNSKGKVKKKTKTKNKVKTKVKKEKANRNNTNRENHNFFTKFLLFFFILISLILIAVTAIFAYNYYQEQNIIVPNVLGYSTNEAKEVLKEAKLSYEIKEEETTNENEIGLVIKQNKKAGSKVHENTIITLTIGILDNHIIVPNVVGMPIEEALNLLNNDGIAYQIIYQETSTDNDKVLKQSIKAGKKIEKTEIITLTVNKSIEEKKDTISKDDEDEDITDNKNTIDNNDNSTKSE